MRLQSEMFENKRLRGLGGEQCYKHFPSCPQPRKSNIAFLKLVFCLYGVNKTLQPELNHSEEMMASNREFPLSCQRVLCRQMSLGNGQTELNQHVCSGMAAHLNHYVFTFPSSIL